jgi:hypothetical protein
MSTHRFATLAMGTLAALALTGPARAAMTSWEEVALPVATTDYTKTVTLTKFDPTLGTLVGVSLRLTGEVTGNIRFESLDSDPSTITATLRANLQLKDSGGALLASLAPQVQRIENVSAFDGLIDFGGASGRSFLNLSAVAGPVTYDTTAPGLLAGYVGPGTFNVSFLALAASTSSGSGNISNFFQTQAGGTVSVRYEYEPATAPVPEPTSLALIGIGGLSGLVYRRRLRRAAGR